MLPVDFVVVSVPPGPARDRYLPLLRLADDSADAIRGYYQTGWLYGLVDRTGRGDERSPLGHILVVRAESASVAELKSVAIAESRQGQGLGRYLVTQVLARLRAEGVTRAVVGTSNASLDNLAFYQKLGFRLWRIDRDYFSPARGYGPELSEDGIPVRDMVWMDMALL